MIDIAETTNLLENYFVNVTNEQFAKDLKEFCPELFEDEHNSSLNTGSLNNDEIYRKAKEDGKLEIAPKLLQKGLSREEVATILEVDINLIASAPANKKTAPVGKSPKAKSESLIEKIVPLTGKALKAKVRELSHLTKSEIAKGCGYFSITKDGSVRVNLTKFYDALLQSEGINVDEKPRSDSKGHEASYIATVHGNG
jgi:AbrB-like transcriptional regulator